MSQRLIRMAELDIEPAHLGRYRSLLGEEIEVTLRSEPDVLMLYALAVRQSPASLRIVEVYANREAYEAHLRTPHFLKYKSQTQGMVRSLRLIDMEPVATFVRRQDPDGDMAAT